MRKLLILLALSLPITLASCGHPATVNGPAAPKSALQTISESLLVSAQTVGTLQTIVIKDNELKLISDDTTRKILDVTSRVALAGKQASALTVGLGQLGPLDKTKIKAIMDPILQAVSDAINTGLVPIQDKNTRDSIQLGLLSIQGVLTSVQVIVTGGN